MHSNTLKFVILNNTLDQPHFGSQRVMKTIKSLIESRGGIIIGSALAGTFWERDRQFLQALERCDAILINGEGTLHHGHAKAERLLKVVDHPLRLNKPVSIINALYQENPRTWERYLDKVQLIIARDSKSHSELSEFYGGKLFRTLDLSLHESPPYIAGNRNGITFGDSVLAQVSRQLMKMSAATEGSIFLPIMTTLKSRKASLPPILRGLRETYTQAHALAYKLANKNIRFAKDELEFLNLLAHSRQHITGRFHGACLSLLVGTPFLSIASNSWKMELLLKDLGLSLQRIVDPTDLQQMDLRDFDIDFSSEEKSNLVTALQGSRQIVESAFDQIVSMD